MPHTRFRYLLAALGREKFGLAGLFAVALLPGLLVGLLLCFAIYWTERGQLEQGALQTSRALLKAVDAEIDKAEMATLVLSQSESLAQRDWPAFYAQAQKLVTTVGVGHNVVLSDLSGQQLINTAQPLGSPLPQHGNPAQLERVLRNQQMALSDLYLGPVLKQPVFSIDLPVLVHGKPAYVLSMGLMPDYFSRLLVQQNLPEDWIVALLDTQHMVVARNLNSQHMLGKKATPDFQAQLEQAPEGVMASHSLEGIPTFLGYTTSAHTGWTLGVGMPRKVLYQSMYRLLALVALSFVVFLASGVGLVWLFGRYVSRSLEALGKVTEAAARGDRSAQAPVSGVQEIDTLAARFNAMQEQQQRMEAEVRHLAYFDPLTQLPNRSLLKDRLAQALRSSRRNARHGALLFLDLDNFKSLNDTQGHVVGDMLLVEVARRLKGLVREIDTVSRFGGDEFVVLLQDLQQDQTQAREQASKLAEKLRRVLAESYELHVKGNDTHPARDIEHHCTASIGVALFFDGEVSEDEIIRRADAAMYHSKEAGRNRVQFYGPPA